MEQGAGTCIKTTFYVLDCNSYHFILGLTLLAVIDGGVFCGSRRLEYTLGPAGDHQRCTISLATRTTARQSPYYTARPQYASMTDTTPPPTHAQLATIPEGWQASCLGEDVLPYVQEALVDVPAWASCNNDSTQYADCFPAALMCTHVDCSLPCPPPPSSSSPACTPCPDHSLHAQVAHVPTYIEAELASKHLGGDFTLPAFQGTLHTRPTPLDPPPPSPTPRHPSPFPRPPHHGHTPQDAQALHTQCYPLHRHQGPAPPRLSTIPNLRRPPQGACQERASTPCPDLSNFPPPSTHLPGSALAAHHPPFPSR